MSNYQTQKQQDAPPQTPRLVADRDGAILYANAAFAALVPDNGAQQKELKGKRLDSILTIENPVNGHDVSCLIAGRGEAILLHYDCVDTADGREFIILSSSQPQPMATRGRDNNIFPLAGRTKTGISANYGGEAEESRDHFLDISQDIMCALDCDFTFTQTSDTFCDLLKTDSAIVAGKIFLDLVYPDDKHLVRQVIGDLNIEGEEQSYASFECRMITGTGAVLSLDWRMKRAGETIYCVGHDLTAIKAHEDALTRQAKKLLEAEAIGRMGHWHWRLGEKCFSWSDEIYRIFGVAKGDFQPQFDSVNKFVHRRDADRIMQVFQRAMIENQDYEVDFRISRQDGAVCFVRCLGRCETDEDGDVIALYGIMQDVTQDTLREQDLRAAKEDVERAYAAKTQFLANMSHELRTPLNAIIGFSEMIQNQLLGPLGNDRYLEYINGIRESGSHLLDLISDILDMSKIEAGKYQLDLEALNAAKIIRTAAHMMEGRALDSAIKIVTDLPCEFIEITADRRALLQILLNVLSNAVKFSKEESEIHIGCSVKEQDIYIKISDQGIGIPAHKLATITNPFEQVSSHYAREHEGSGLGLAITKELTEMHGGALDIQSQIDVGTTVIIRLPSQSKAMDRKEFNF